MSAGAVDRAFREESGRVLATLIRHLGGDFVPARDYKDLFSTRPENTFLVKASYWFSL